jgi:hypothetical protein
MKHIRALPWLLLALQLSLAAHADSATAETRAAFLKVIERPKVALKPELAELPRSKA